MSDAATPQAIDRGALSRRPAPATVTVFTRRNPARTSAALRRLLELARASGVRVQVPQAEVAKHGLRPDRDGVVATAAGSPCDVAVALGGDGTILHALRTYAGTGTPVFAINFGAIGFLATVEGDRLEEGLARLFSGDFEVLALPALELERKGQRHIAFNDVAVHRRHGGRVAELAYFVSGEELGEVRCDGLVVATPAGSTGYNLANGGPVLAWGVEGYVVSFIAPHTLTARALVVAPADHLELMNRSAEEAVDVVCDGRTVSELDPHERLPLRFAPRRALLAQLPGASFYARLRSKFGLLAS